MLLCERRLAAECNKFLADMAKFIIARFSYRFNYNFKHTLKSKYSKKILNISLECTKKDLLCVNPFKLFLYIPVSIRQHQNFHLPCPSSQHSRRRQYNRHVYSGISGNRHAPKRQLPEQAFLYRLLHPLKDYPDSA